ncbi:CMP deaminase [Methylobacterium sp. WL120]|uniref:CMP deaminase n=1 Tax=Methylobacterium sp. WL120 TaxID=2603887 RepID=UPI0011CC3EB3|nr:CMP deaminase [Methylobacterium sp. WL120]TXM68318.1 CMP deaminase [Methylobacterium sp. WL120]
MSGEAMAISGFDEPWLGKWDHRFLDRAAVVATYSKDPSSKVGAVLVRPDNTTAGEGFNGFPAGLDDSPHLYLDRDYKIATVIHAEENAILNSRDHSMVGYTLFVSGLPPCCSCASKIIQKGISRVVAHDRKVPARWAQNMRWAVANMLQKGIVIDLFNSRTGRWRSVNEPDDLWIEEEVGTDPSQICGCAA